MARFQAERADGSLYIGSPETVATKIAAMMRLLGLSRFDLAYATGRMPHQQRLATIELFGREVIPRVRELLADHPVPPIPSSRRSEGVTAQPRV
jgi:alkanesulfonate monooxygenase SsuD/methylene tetrahydromethanopterin reductase-like flavin-dependent oxidoreductase (luciferase family)